MLKRTVRAFSRADPHALDPRGIRRQDRARRLSSLTKAGSRIWEVLPWITNSRTRSYCSTQYRWAEVEQEMAVSPIAFWLTMDATPTGPRSDPSALVKPVQVQVPPQPL